MCSCLPNVRPLINALTCCGNPDCGNKKAEGETKTDAEPLLLLQLMCPDCRSVYYCNVDCQKTHSKNHKHQCNKDTQKLNEEKEWMKNNHNKENTDNDDGNDDDNKLFQPVPPQDDCPVCFHPLPIEGYKRTYMTCCGNLMCVGCNKEHRRVTLERGLFPCCAFCRESYLTLDNEDTIRIKKRMELNDSEAIYLTSQYYEFGIHGLPKNPQKAFELCLYAAKLSHANACNTLAMYYKDGVIVAKDMTKARKYCEKAAKKGNIWARHNLGCVEWEKGNYHTAGRHWLLSTAAGHAGSLAEIAKFYKFQLVTKEEHSTTLTSYVQVHKDEWIIERERAAAGIKYSSINGNDDGDGEDGGNHQDDASDGWFTTNYDDINRVVNHDDNEDDDGNRNHRDDEDGNNNDDVSEFTNHFIELDPMGNIRIMNLIDLYPMGNISITNLIDVYPMGNIF